MKTASKNLLSFTSSEESLDHTIQRGLFGNVWDVLVFALGTATVILTWTYHTVFQATKDQKDPIEALNTEDKS